MKERELDLALGELAGRRIDAPDLRGAVLGEIARRKMRGGRAGVFTSGVPGMRTLMPVSVAAAVLIGVAFRFTQPLPARENPRAEAAVALHLDMFDVAVAVRPSANLFTPEP